jgi:dolichyl-phosphate-mannose-protein mannosyltransferase
MRARLDAEYLSQMAERGGVIAAVLVGLIARVVLTSVQYDWTPPPTFGDDVSYVHYANVLLQTGELESHHFPIGYPLFVAFWLKLTGSFAAIRLSHVALSAWTIALVSKVAEHLYGRRAGLGAAWLTALYPPLIFMNGRIMSETLFIALLMYSLHRFLVADRSGRMVDGALAGGVFALSALVRSNLLVMLPFVPLWQLWRLRTGDSASPAVSQSKKFSGVELKRRLLLVIATGAVAGVIVLLPGLYFLEVKGEFIPSATNAGQTFYGANNPMADGGWVQMEDHQEYLASIPPEVRKKATAYSKAQFHLGFEWIRENPGAFLRLLPKKLGNAWIPGLQSSETTRSSKLASLVLIVFNLPLLLAALVGRLKNPPKARDGLLLAVLATYTLLSLAFYGNPRIGLFCSPILIVFASSWVTRFGRNAGRHAGSSLT